MLHQNWIKRILTVLTIAALLCSGALTGALVASAFANDEDTSQSDEGAVPNEDAAPPRPADDIIPAEELAAEQSGNDGVSNPENFFRVEGKSKDDALSRRLQIVVHKSMKETGRQHLDMILDGVKIHTFTVSTAWERKAKAKGIDPTTGRPKVYLAKTPNGTFVLDGILPKRYSHLWKVWLKYVLMFSGGVWIHATTPEHYAELGAPASGGCVRVHEEDAKVIWDKVSAMGADNVAITILPAPDDEKQIKPVKAPGRWIEGRLETAIFDNNSSAKAIGDPQLMGPILSEQMAKQAAKAARNASKKK